MSKFYQTLKIGLASSACFFAAAVANAAYPSVNQIGSATGQTYNFSSEMTQGPNYNSLKSSLRSNVRNSFQFSIVVFDGVPQVNNFIADTPLYATYDESTGLFKFRTNYFGNFTQYYGFAVDGIWSGYKMNYTTEEWIWQFNEDGSISIPDFSLFAVDKETVQSNYATFVNCSAVKGANHSESENPGTSYNPIEGNWTISYTDTDGLEPNTSYEVTSSGRTVTFTQATAYGAGEYTFIGTLDGNTLTFAKQATSRATYPKYQIPFTDAGEVDSFTATFNDSELPYTITFPAGAGFYFQNMDPETQQVLDYKGGMVINEAFKVKSFSSELKLKIDMDVTTSSGSTLYAVFNYTASAFDINEITTWKAEVNLIVDQDDDGNNILQPVSDCTVDFDAENRNFTVTIPNQAYGRNGYQIIVTGYNSDGEELVVSSPAYVSLMVGPGLELIQPSATVDGFNVTYRLRILEINAIPDNARYELQYVPYEDAYPSSLSDADPDYTTNAKYADAELINGYIYSTITVDAPGKYDYAFAINVYNENDALVVRSNWNSLIATIADPQIPAITISNPSGSLEENGTFNISFSVELANIDEVAYYIAEFSYADHDKGGAASKSEEVEVNEGVVSVSLSDMPIGSYAVNITLTAYDSDNEVIATSNEIILSDYNSGVDSIRIENGNARYYNLNGIEVANPQRGIFIRLQDGKATKVVI